MNENDLNVDTQVDTQVDTPVNTPDAQVQAYNEDIDKYTKIDNLDEDGVVDSCKYFLVSFISPEGIMNCSTRGLKIRTHKNKVYFATLEEAKHAADEINKNDKYFHVFVGETGKWMGWDPEPDDRTRVEDEVWANADQNAIMQKMREKEDKQKTQLDELNALVGKKKDMIKDEKKSHNNRIKEAIKEGAKGESSEPDIVTEKEMKKEKHITKMKNARNSQLIREKLRKKMNDKKMNDPKSLVPTSEVLKENSHETSNNEDKINQNIEKLTELLNKSKHK